MKYLQCKLIVLPPLRPSLPYETYWRFTAQEGCILLRVLCCPRFSDSHDWSAFRKSLWGPFQSFQTHMARVNSPFCPLRQRTTDSLQGKSPMLLSTTWTSSSFLSAATASFFTSITWTWKRWMISKGGTAGEQCKHELAFSRLSYWALRHV